MLYTNFFIMKSEYIKPMIDVYSVSPSQFITNSVKGTGLTEEFNYGGKDDGTHDPSAKEFEFEGNNPTNDTNEDDWMDEEEDW